MARLAADFSSALKPPSSWNCGPLCIVAAPICHSQPIIGVWMTYRSRNSPVAAGFEGCRPIIMASSPPIGKSIMKVAENPQCFCRKIINKYLGKSPEGQNPCHRKTSDRGAS